MIENENDFNVGDLCVFVEFASEGLQGAACVITKKKDDVIYYTYVDRIEEPKKFFSLKIEMFIEYFRKMQ